MDFCLITVTNWREQINWGTTTKIKTRLIGSQVCFDRIYICFEALKKGFKKGCRPIIVVDGFHLKENQKGHILSVVGIDSNNGMFPITYSVVKSKCKDSFCFGF